jgi:hypothetical protein
VKDKVIQLLALMVGLAILTAIVGDYITAALETQKLVNQLRYQLR